jgi:hypothetical protein
MRALPLVALALLAGTALAAAPKWELVGESVNGDKVFVDRANLKTVGGVTTVTFRSEIKSPLDTPSGAITSMRATMKVSCKDMTSAGVEVVLFEDEAKNKVFSRGKAPKDDWVKEPEGSGASLVVRHLCKAARAG